MGRTRTINDDELLTLVKSYFSLECNYNPRLLKTGAISQYVRDNGYPDFKDFLLRRCEPVRNFIDTAKESAEQSHVSTVSTYKTVDADQFFKVNTSMASRKRALMELDSYYKSVADSASEIFLKHNELQEKILTLEKTISQQKLELDSLQQMLADSEKKERESRQTIAKLEDIVKNYVYPDIATELLISTGDMKAETIIDENKLEENLIKADTTVKDGVVLSLFDRYGD